MRANVSTEDQQLGVSRPPLPASFGQLMQSLFQQNSIKNK